MRRLAVMAPLVVGAVLALTPGVAQAKFSASGSGAATLRAATMKNASGFAAACTDPTTNKTGITLTWTLSSDAFVAGYTIVRSRNNAVDATLTVPASPGTYDDAFTALNPAKGDVFTYTIRATKSNWTTTTLAGTGAPGFVANKNQCA